MRVWMTAALAVCLCACDTRSERDPSTIAAEAKGAGLDRIPDQGPCDVFGAATASLDIEPGCSGCSIENAERAHDGDFATFATVRTDATPGRTGAVVLRVNASDARYPAGAQPGVQLSWPDGVGRTAPYPGFEVRLYQGASQVDYTNYYVISRGPGSSETVLLSAAAEYDGVGFALLAQAVPEAVEVRVHEFCVRGD